MRNLKLFCFGIIIFITSVSSCKKKPVEIITSSAPESSEECPPFAKPSIFVTDPSHYSVYGIGYIPAVEMNPNNENEIIYIEGSHPNRLMYYNLQTNEKRVLFERSVACELSWSVKGWILFKRAELGYHSVYKIKADGDSLTQLSQYDIYHHAHWNSDGTKIITFNKYKPIGHKTRIMNENFEEIDSLNIWDHTVGIWSHPNYYLGSHPLAEIVVIDIINNAFIKKITFPNENVEVRVLKWVSLHEFWYVKNTALYKYDMNTGESVMIFKECYNSIRFSAVSSDFSKIIVIKTESTELPDYKVQIDTKVLRMGLNGKELEEINL